MYLCVYSFYVALGIFTVNKEETPIKGVAQTSLPQTSSMFSDMRSEGGLQKMGNLFHNKTISRT